MDWDYQSILANAPVLWKGLLGTLVLGVVCNVLAVIIGLIVGAGRYSRNRLLYWPATAFVEFFRNTPVLVQIIWFFFAFPIFTGIKLSPYWAAALGISLNGGAYCAEIFRGGIQNIARGQWEACKAIGMNYRQTMRRTILPQAIKRMLPAFTNRSIEILKATAIASVVAYFELLHSARVISAANFNPIESYTAVAVIFVVMIYPLTVGARYVEARLRVSD
jgi:polar amino acid transport system permease protein